MLLLRGRDGGGGPKAVRSEPLAYVPAGSADVVFDLDTHEPLVALAVEQLAPRVTKGALTADQVHALVGGRVVVAIDAGKAWLAFATTRRRPPTRGAAAAARAGRGRRRAERRRSRARAPRSAARPRRRYARATFDKRFAGLPADAGARVAFDPQRAARPSARRRLAATRGARSLRDGAAVLTHARDRAARPVSGHRRPGGPDAPPTCRSPPARSRRSARGSAPLVARPARPGANARLRALGRAAAQLDLLDQLPGFLKPDLTTSAPTGRSRARRWTSPASRRASSRPTPATGRPAWAHRHAAGLAGKAVLGDLEHRPARRGLHADAGRAARRPRRRLRPRAVLSDDPAANLRAAAAAPPRPTPGAAGALTARLRSSLLAAQIPELIRARIGDLTAWARAELTGVTGELRLALR